MGESKPGQVLKPEERAALQKMIEFYDNFLGENSSTSGSKTRITLTALLCRDEFGPALPVSALEHLRQSVPEYYSDAIKRWPWLQCEPHEWDNRTSLENVEYLVIESARKLIVYLGFEADKKAFEEWYEKHGQHLNMASKLNLRAGWLARAELALPHTEVCGICEDDAVNCSGCRRFSRYCPKCTNGSGT